MLRFVHTMLLAALGGVHVADAIEAALYERKRPAVPRDEALGPAARVIVRRADLVERQVEAEIFSSARGVAGEAR